MQVTWNGPPDRQNGGGLEAGRRTLVKVLEGLTDKEQGGPCRNPGQRSWEERDTR